MILVSMILAQKVWDDKSLRTSSFTLIVPEYSKDRIKKWEMRFLELMQYSGVVTQQLYTRYYFELRVLYETIHQGSQFPLEPMSLAKAKRLEIVSNSMQMLPPKNDQGFGRSSAAASHSQSTEPARAQTWEDATRKRGGRYVQS